MNTQNTHPVRRARAQTGLSQILYAALAGCSHGQVERAERCGLERLPASLRDKTAEILGVDPVDVEDAYAAERANLADRAAQAVAALG